ncbi:hypothetical protein GJ496_005769 [Pomphorhynchus laevis]|nr:hypothetical protein GJ496_005769 [Pomphorhynchus laevis]
MQENIRCDQSNGDQEKLATRSTDIEELQHQIPLNFSYNGCVKQELSSAVDTFLKTEHKAFGCAYCDYRSRYRGDVYKHQGRRHQDKQRSLLKYYESGNVVCLPVKQPEKVFNLKTLTLPTTESTKTESLSSSYTVKDDSEENSSQFSITTGKDVSIAAEESSAESSSVQWLSTNESRNTHNSFQKVDPFNFVIDASNPGLSQLQQPICTDVMESTDMHSTAIDNSQYQQARLCSYSKNDLDIFICSRCGHRSNTKSEILHHINCRSLFENHQANIIKIREEKQTSNVKDMNVLIKNLLIPADINTVNSGIAGDQYDTTFDLINEPRCMTVSCNTKKCTAHTMMNNDVFNTVVQNEEELLPKKRSKLINENEKSLQSYNNQSSNNTGNKKIFSNRQFFNAKQYGAVQESNTENQSNTKVSINKLESSRKIISSYGRPGKRKDPFGAGTITGVSCSVEKKKSRKSDGSNHIVGYKKIKCKHCFYRSNWKGDLVRHVTKEHNGVPSEDIGFLSEYDATRTFEEYERTFGRLLRSRLLIGLIEYKDVPWALALNSLARNITAATRQAMIDGIVPKINHRLTRISAEFLRLMQSTNMHYSSTVVSSYQQQNSIIFQNPSCSNYLNDKNIRFADLNNQDHSVNCCHPHKHFQEDSKINTYKENTKISTKSTVTASALQRTIATVANNINYPVNKQHEYHHYYSQSHTFNNNEGVCLDLSNKLNSPVYPSSTPCLSASLTKLKTSIEDRDFIKPLMKHKHISNGSGNACLLISSDTLQSQTHSSLLPSTSVAASPHPSQISSNDIGENKHHVNFITKTPEFVNEIRCNLCSRIWTYKTLSNATRHHDLHMTAGGYECMACHCCSYFRCVIASHNIRKHGNCALVRRIRRFGIPECVYSVGGRSSCSNDHHNNDKDQNQQLQLNQNEKLHYNATSSKDDEYIKSVLDQCDVTNNAEPLLFTGKRYRNIPPITGKKEDTCRIAGLNKISTQKQSIKNCRCRGRAKIYRRKIYSSTLLDNESIFACSYCRYTSQDWWDFMQHRQIHRLRKGAIFQCYKCCSYFKTIDELVNHKMFCISVCVQL